MEEAEERIRNSILSLQGKSVSNPVEESYGQIGFDSLRFAEPQGVRDGVTEALKTPFQLPGSPGLSPELPVGGSVGDSEQEAKQWIIGKESSGKTTAKNPNSSAFGLGQMIRANREAYAKRLGVDPDTTDYDAQSAMMDMYVKDRYGTYQKAREFWEKNQWY